MIKYYILILMGFAGWSWAVDIAPETVDLEKTNGVPRIGKLSQLEAKAEERDKLATKVKSLEEALEKERTETGERKPNAGSRLKDLELQASGYVALQAAMEKKNAQINYLLSMLAATSNRCEELKIEVKALTDANIAASNTILQLQQTGAQQRTAIELLLLGQFEYYEVRAGDSLESIAKDPMIYNDVNKVDWLRRANQGRVKDLEHLTEGELMVIPRFPVNTQFSF